MLIAYLKLAYTQVGHWSLRIVIYCLLYFESQRFHSSENRLMNLFSELSTVPEKQRNNADITNPYFIG